MDLDFESYVLYENVRINVISMTASVDIYALVCMAVVNRFQIL